MFSTDGGRMPCAEDFAPKPDYRRPRYSETPEFQQRFANLENDQMRARYAMILIQQTLGVDGKDLLKAVSDLLDEHREYEVRLGIHKPCYFNAG